MPLRWRRLPDIRAAAWGLTGLTLLMATALCQAWSLEVPPRDLLPPAGLLAVLMGLAAYYRRRREAAFVLSLTSLAQTVAFVTCFIVLMYAVATSARPLIDTQLAAFDAWCGITVPVVREWSAAHPLFNLLLNFAYDTLLYQTALVLIALGLAGDRSALEGFLASFMLSALTSLVLFVLFPAEGPFVTYGLNPSLDQAQFLDHFRALRDGTRTLVTYRGAEGLITFPSFHVAWAITITWSLRNCRRSLFLTVLTLNLLVIVSTMSTGWHYFADVLGGTVVATLSIVAANRFRARRL
ncbi:MAG TPA: phosphatase PAP2 family protein [Pirellulales bacterium]|nr:phosphatase PAP2 family protein [Pirellulales bacterium]